MKKLTNDEVLNLTTEKAWEIAKSFGNYLELNSKRVLEFDTVLEYDRGDILLALLHLLKVNITNKKTVEIISTNIIILFSFFIPDEESYRKMLRSKKISDGLLERAHDVYNTKRVLVVDDEVYLREMYVDIVRKIVANVDAVSDGSQALTAISGTYYDLILLDIVMPNMTGIELLEIVKAKNIKYGTIIIVSNLDTLEVKKKAFELGASDFWVTADITQDQLAFRLRYLLM